MSNLFFLHSIKYKSRMVKPECEFITLQAYEEESDPDTPSHKPPTPMKVVASAGLVGFNVAQDLLTVDFSTPEEAPEEFRAMPFNSQKSVEIKPGFSGEQTTLNMYLHFRHQT
jgi:hypothetical protein